MGKKRIDNSINRMSEIVRSREDNMRKSDDKCEVEEHKRIRRAAYMVKDMLEALKKGR